MALAKRTLAAMRAALLMLAWGAAGPLPAQDAPPPAEAGSGTPAERPPPAGPTPSERVFKPSEEVSPDMEVDFPADI